MNLHEYQAKTLLKSFGIPIPKGEVIRSIGETNSALMQLGGHEWIVKAQIHAGGRGEAGGIRFISNREELEASINRMLNHRLITKQTPSIGQPINHILIEKPVSIFREIYLCFLIDQTHQSIRLMVSEGGTDIERLASDRQLTLKSVFINPLHGLQNYQCREIAEILQFAPQHGAAFISTIKTLYDFFIRYDLTQLEINPLVITKQDDLCCLDVKCEIDDHALYRQPELRALRDTSQENENVCYARRAGLNYTELNGKISTIVNGVGLAMSIMDLMHHQGYRLANIIDIGADISFEQLKAALSLTQKNTHSTVLLINIFAGMMSADDFANLFINAIAELDLKQPIVMRLAGRDAKAAQKRLRNSGLELYIAHNTACAINRIIQILKK